MTLFGVPKELHDNVVAQLQAERSEHAQTKAELQTTNTQWNHWKQKAETLQPLAEENGKRAEALELENTRLVATLRGLANAADGWHNFGGDRWHLVDSITNFRTEYYHPNGDNLPTEICSVIEINGFGTSPMPSLDEVLAVLSARQKALRGGNGEQGPLDGDDLPSSRPPLPTPQTHIGYGLDRS